MKILKQFFSVLFVLLCVVGTGYAATFDGVRELVSRRAPWLGKHIQFKEIASSDGDCFILQTVGKKLVVQATGANAAAVGVNWYLKYYCHRSMSHLGDQLAPVTELPVIGQPVTVKTTSIYRYALNYCTFNYTMSFYDWDDWQWELDWMALNGVNLMLVANGSEAVWQNTLRRMNYSEKEIADFITGPAYNAWWLMGNIEGWGGPMPQSQIDSRKKLVQKMLKRMKSLGIEPLMPGFYGMVPSNLKNKSKAHIIPQGTWGAFTRPDILDPMDPEFDRVAAIFYDETRRLYGSDIRFFSGDPFHEGGATDGVALGDAGRAIQKRCRNIFPDLSGCCKAGRTTRSRVCWKSWINVMYWFRNCSGRIPITGKPVKATKERLSFGLLLQTSANVPVSTENYNVLPMKFTVPRIANMRSI